MEPIDMPVIGGPQHGTGWSPPDSQSETYWSESLYEDNPDHD